jgi:hypothetical protein
MIFETFNDIQSYFGVKQIEHTLLTRIFAYIKYPVQVYFDYGESIYNDVTGKIMVQGQSKAHFLHEVAHKSIIQKFNSPYPAVYNSTEEFNFLKSTKDVLCKLFLILQEKCIDICEIKRNSSEELNSDIVHVHASLHQFLSQSSCLKALGEYGNSLYEIYNHIAGKYYTTTFLAVLDIAIPLIANITPSNFSHKESNKAIYLAFAELESTNIETLRNYIFRASKMYLPISA